MRARALGFLEKSIVILPLFYFKRPRKMIFSARVGGLVAVVRWRRSGGVRQTFCDATVAGSVGGNIGSRKRPSILYFLVGEATCLLRLTRACFGLLRLTSAYFGLLGFVTGLSTPAQALPGAESRRALMPPPLTRESGSVTPTTTRLISASTMESTHASVRPL